MLEQTYMDQGVSRGVTSKRRTIHLEDDVFTRLDQYVAEHGDTKINTVTKAVMDLVGGQREKFLKMYAPHIRLTHSSKEMIILEDQDLDKVAVVIAQWNNIVKNKEKRSLMSLYCQLCSSDSCIHVRYSLVLPDILQIQKEGKLV